MTQDPIDPSEMETIFMRCLSDIIEESTDNNRIVHKDAWISEIEKRTSEKMDNVIASKTIKRLRDEGFISVDEIGLVKMLPCGSLNFKDEY
jgi:hypothetical protein